MKLSGNTVLITGGTSGIGLALAERFLKENEVIICSRSDERLNETVTKLPGLHIIRCDVSEEGDRIALFNKVTSEFPTVNIVINNAGIQQRLNLKDVDFDTCRAELATNLEAPIHLSVLFIKALIGKDNAHIVNVSSGLAFRPPVWAPVYGATKAGLHSFTFSLRAQIADTGIKVMEVIPPAVNTNLGGPGMHTFGADVDKYADSVWRGFEMGDDEIGFEGNLETRDQTRAQLEQAALESFGRQPR